MITKCLWTVRCDAACYSSWKRSNYKIEKFQHLVVCKTLVCYVSINNACVHSLMCSCNTVTHIMPPWISAHMHTNGVFPHWILCYNCFACWGLEQLISMNLCFTISSSGVIPGSWRGMDLFTSVELVWFIWTWREIMWQPSIASVKWNQFFLFVAFYYLTEFLYMPPW